MLHPSITNVSIRFELSKKPILVFSETSGQLTWTYRIDKGEANVGIFRSPAGMVVASLCIRAAFARTVQCAPLAFPYFREAYGSSDGKTMRYV